MAGEFSRRLQRNLAELAEHRPQIHRILMQTQPPQNYRLRRGRGGRWTVGMVGEDGRVVCVSRGDDPIGGTLHAWAQMKPAWQKGSGVALCGIGDGYALGALAAHPPAAYLDRQQPVFVIEPESGVLWSVLCLHDFSGADGPIRQARFRWFVGADWAEQFHRELLTDSFLPFPAAYQISGMDPGSVEKAFRETGEALMESDRQLAQQIAESYSTMDAQTLAPLFGENPPRRPRVLLITSLFTTVLQYSTADAAEAMAKLGWETRTVVEQAAYHRPVKRSFRQALMEFKPDLVLVIDHLRQEYNDTFPDGLPYACWIQDYLPNLKDPEAGPKVTKRDYVLTASGTEFVRNFGYPARQIVDMPNLGRVPARPASWSSDGLDLAYTSNWSQTTEQAVEDILNKLSGSPEMRTIADATCARMLDIYQRGDCLAVQQSVRTVIEQAQNDCGLAIADPALLDSVVNQFWQKLNNHLFRQQSLEWVAQIAQRRGWQLGIFGRGWENHPRFAEFARGFVKPGADLEEMVRSTRINLHLEPYACFTHPRLLSGLFAGGFFLVRDNPFNHLSVKLARFLSENFDAGVETSQDARQAMAPGRREELESVLSECAPLGEQADTVQWVRNWQRAGLLPEGKPPMSYLPDIAFDDAATLERRIEQFVADGPLRGRIAEAQRNDLESRLSYEAGMTRMCRRIEQLLRTEEK